MEIFEHSRLSKNRKIVEEIKGGSRGQLYEVVDESPATRKKSCKNARCRDFALRIYDADSTLQSHGLSPNLLKQTQGLILKHPNLLELHDVDMVFACSNFAKDGCQRAHLLMLTELASGNLHHWLEMFRAKTSPEYTIHLMNDILQGIAFLHRNQYVHRRINPCNIMMVEKDAPDHFRAKLGDFQDVSVFFQSDSDEPLPVSGHQSTYTAPEILMGYEHYLPAADMWSFGVVMFEMIFGKDTTPFFNHERDTSWFGPPQKSRVVDNIFSWLGTPTREWRETYTHEAETRRKAIPGRTVKQVIIAEAETRQHGFKDKTFHLLMDLIDSCLRIDPEKRITALHALKHPLFQKFHMGLTRGQDIKMPAVPSTPRGTFAEIRRDMLRTAARDIEGGYMYYYPTLMAINLFDRSHEFFTQDIYEDSADGSINTALVYNLYCTCYLMAVKLMIELPRPVHDLFQHVKGIVCGNTDSNRLTMLFMERTIATRLKFRFFVNEVATLPLTMGIFTKLERQPLRPHKFKL